MMPIGAAHVTEPEGAAVDTTAFPYIDVVTDASPADGSGAPPDSGTGDRRGGGRGKRPRRSSARRTLIEWAILIGSALAIALLIKTFLFQAFYIPSESMTPTLQVGDRVLVNKLSYKLHDVNRGDIVVFKAPDGEGAAGVKDLVKRVIGLPGETIELREGNVFVDGEPLDEPYLADGESTTPTQNFSGKCEPPASESTCVVPADSYLVLGDNRNESKDGRVFGPIQESDIVGRVFVRIWPIGDIGFM